MRAAPVAILCITAAVAAAQLRLESLGWHPDARRISVFDVSADGSRLIGVMDFGKPFLWSPGVGFTPFESPDPGSAAGPTAISPDGRFACGWILSGELYGARMSLQGGPGQLLGNMEVTTDISGDGSVVVGYNGNVAKRWQNGRYESVQIPSGGPTGSSNVSVSADGNTIVGTSFVWQYGQQVWQIPDLRGGLVDLSGLTADGRVAFGFANPMNASTTSGGFFRITGWDSAGGPQYEWLFDTAPGVTDIPMIRSADDGNTAVIRTSILSNLIWSRRLGMLTSAEFFTRNDIDISAWTNLAATSVSADGRTFVGYATNTTTGRQEGWIVTIPAPGAALIAVLGLMITRRERENK